MALGAWRELCTYSTPLTAAPKTAPTQEADVGGAVRIHRRLSSMSAAAAAALKAFQRQMEASIPTSNQPCPRAEKETGTPQCHSTICNKDHDTASRCARHDARQGGTPGHHSKQEAYLNLDSECANALSEETRLTGLLSPGPQFSVRGRLVHTRAIGDNGKHRFQGGTRVQFVLAPEDALQYLTWRNERAQFEPLQPPAKINRGFFQCWAYEKAVDVSSVPKFPCINTPSLRTSRDC